MTGPVIDVPTGCVRVGDVALAWEDHGHGSRPLVLVHGFTGSRDDWSDVIDRIAALGRTVLFDQRGHGASSKPGREDAYSLDQLVVDLDGFLTAIGIEHCDLLGHSLGGAVALHYALAHPSRVASLVLMDTSAYAPQELRDDLVAAANLVRTDGIAWLVDQVAARPLDGEDLVIAGRQGEREFRRRVGAQLAAVDPAAFVALATLLGDHEPVTDRLREITCSTTVLVGSEDAPFLAPSRELAAGIPDATLVVLAGGGHSPQKSATEAWIEAVSDHLRRARD
jgi:2-succinyl-6-hydroxy-2,4-cyclohexadiene-1-carboxylate synthase